jgi:hypothetical protein
MMRRPPESAGPGARADADDYRASPETPRAGQTRPLVPRRAIELGQK